MHLLIAAAGSGSRMGAQCNKLLLKILEREILDWTLDAACRAESIEWIGIVGQPLDKNDIMKFVVNYSKEIVWINGGKSRQESVQLGISALPQRAEFVLIHDGARCLVSPDLFDKCTDELLQGNSVIAAHQVVDTIKRVDDKGFISSTPTRSELWSAQTPQGFLVEKLKEAHHLAIIKGWEVTDDSSLFERLKWPVKILESNPSNIKVTTPFDLLIAEAFLASKSQNLMHQ